MKFMVGDIVVCKEKDRYAITDVGIPCVVSAVDDECMTVMPISKGKDSSTYTVYQKYFEYAPSGIIAQSNVPPFKSVTVNKAKKKITVVYGKGDYQIATCTEHDTFDPAIGMALAMAYKAFGSKTKFHKFVNDIMDKK